MMNVFFDSGENKRIDRLLARMRGALDAGNVHEVEAVLSERMSSEFLNRVREQKLVLRAPLALRGSMVALLRSASSQLEPTEKFQFDSYLEFALTIDDERRHCLENVHALLAGMPRCSTFDLLAIAEEVFHTQMDQLARDADIYSVNISVAERERRLHDLNGAANDVVMALARVINECCRAMSMAEDVRLCGDQRRKAVQILLEAFTPASAANSLEWFFDSVTYGEFTVERVQDTGISTYQLNFVDARRYLLKTLAIRRSLVLRVLGRRNPRFVRDRLNEISPAVLKSAVIYYLREGGRPEHSPVDLTGARARSEAMLKELDAEDDLLMAASRLDQRVISHYFVSMAMRWYTAAAESVDLNFQVDDQGFPRVPSIPLMNIEESIGGVDGGAITEAIDNLTVLLPARSHLMLIDRPFVRDGAGRALPFLRGGVGSWTSVVRENLIKGGAIGKSVGALWEDFCASSFDDSDWKVVGRGVKLRSNGQILTDVDLFLLREDLLLVVQIKALVGLGNTPYQHWRNRQTIQLGCVQARVAVDFLKADLDRLVSICGRRSSAQIKHLQPLVLTNVHQLDGWQFNDVPVISEVTRKAICQGAKVDYQESQNGEVIHTHHFVKREELTTAAILQLISQPTEMRIAAEGTGTWHSIHEVGGLRLLMPEFEIRSTESGQPLHEPHPNAFVKQGMAGEVR